MENYLKEINSVLGVVGSFVCLPDGSLAVKALPDTFDAASVETAARILTQTLSALEMSGQHVVETDLVYGQGRLLLKNLRGGILAIVCARTINIPLLNLTANGVAKKLAAELKPKPAPPLAMPPNAVIETTSPVAMPPNAVIETTPPAPAPVSIPAIPPEESDAGTVPVRELANDRFFDQLTRELTRFMGPVSSIIIDDEIDELKEKRGTFPKARMAELVARVGLAIHDEAKRGRFLLVMSGITQNQ